MTSLCRILSESLIKLHTALSAPCSSNLNAAYWLPNDMFARAKQAYRGGIAMQGKRQERDRVRQKTMGTGSV